MQNDAGFRTRMNEEVILIKKINVKIDGLATDPQKIITQEDAGNDDTANAMSDSDVLASLMPNANSL
jgi:hypothetical protein